MNLEKEKTFVMIKPDGVRRGLIGEIIQRIEQRGLKVVACQLFQATRDQIDEHYPKDKRWVSRLGEKSLDTYQKYNISAQKELGTADANKIGQLVRGWLIDFLTSGPMVKMVVEGIHAIDMMRKLCGPSVPSKAELGSIRGDYSVDSPALANARQRAIHNLIHASETPEEAVHEIALWFTDKEIQQYKRSEEE